MSGEGERADREGAGEREREGMDREREAMERERGFSK